MKWYVCIRNIIDEFLDPQTSPEQKAKLGDFILMSALRGAVDDLVPVHKELRRKGYVSRERANKVRKTMGNFFTRAYYPDYYDKVAYVLAKTA